MKVASEGLGSRGTWTSQVVSSPRGTTKPKTEACMNEDQFNMEIRKFLKKVGVTSQREIERAVQEGIASGQLQGNETLKARVTLSIAGLGLSHDIDGDISLE